MTERERLLEEYEDAYFSLLMYDIAEIEGKRLVEINNALQKDPTFVVPEQVQKRSLKSIRRYFRKQRTLSALKSSRRIISKAAVFFLISTLLFSSVYAAVPEVRANTLNLLIKVSDVSTSLIMDAPSDAPSFEEKGSDADSLLGYKMPEIPDGYELVCENTFGPSFVYRYYQGPNNSYFSISVSNGNNMNYNIDTENAIEISPININGLEGLLVKKAQANRATLIDVANGYYLYIDYSTIEDSEALEMLSEMQKVS